MSILRNNPIYHTFISGSFSVLLGVVIILVSCQSKTVHHTEINQVFQVRNTQAGYESGAIIYQDSVVYQNANLPLVKFIFDRQKKITGIERYPRIRSSQSNTQSSYETVSGEALSYYKYYLRKDYLKRRVEAYDASNDDLLRYEELEYNDKDQLTVRKIFTSEGHLATSYSLLYDVYGNELRKITQHLLRDTIITEESRITKYTKDNDWSEKWGFVNDKPVAYYKKIIIE